MQIYPIYRLESHILLGLDIDFMSPHINDSLVVEIDLQAKIMIHRPWSGQKKLKFGYYDAIDQPERITLTEYIYNEFPEDLINEIIDALLHPGKEEINSLIWVPERLK